MAKKGSKGPRAKYNWDILKLEFFKHQIHDVKPWLRETKIPYSGHSVVMTRGWTEEKRDWIRTMVAEEQRRVEDSFKLSTSELLDIKRAAIRAAAQKMMPGKEIAYTDSAGNEKKIWMPDAAIWELKDIWTMSKAELGEPTSVSKNLNEDMKRTVELSDEDVERLTKDAHNRANRS